MVDTPQAAPSATPVRVVAPVTAPVPEKNVLSSNAMWASIATIVLGVLAQVDGLQAIALFLKSNVEQIVGVIATVVGIYGAWATARRKTTLKL